MEQQQTTYGLAGMNMHYIMTEVTGTPTKLQIVLLLVQYQETESIYTSQLTVPGIIMT